MYIVRENTEGEYSSIGGRIFSGTEREMVMQETVMTRIGVDRVLKYAFNLAQSRPKQHLTSATKSNGIAITMPFWDERVVEMAASYPDVEVDKFHIDILTAHFVQRPDFFDVVVASNLFGDILSDLGPACTGHDWDRAERQPQPAGGVPLTLRAGSWVRARHRRTGDRQPDRPDLVRRDDAGLPRSPTRARRDPRGDRDGARPHQRRSAHA